MVSCRKVGLLVSLDEQFMHKDHISLWQRLHRLEAEPLHHTAVLYHEHLSRTTRHAIHTTLPPRTRHLQIGECAELVILLLRERVSQELLGNVIGRDRPPRV